MNIKLRVPTGVISCTHRYSYAYTWIHASAHSSVCRHRATHSHKYIIHIHTDLEKHADIYVDLASIQRIYLLIQNLKVANTEMHTHMHIQKLIDASRGS